MWEWLIKTLRDRPKCVEQTRQIDEAECGPNDRWSA